MNEHVLAILPTNGHGGCEYNALSALKYLRDTHGIAVTASFPIVPETAFVEELCRANGIEVAPFDGAFERNDDPQRAQAHREATRTLIGQVQPSVAFVPMPWPKRGQGVIAGCADCGLPTVVKFALVPDDYGQGEFILPAARAAIDSRQLWFANSRISAELIERHWSLRARSVDSFHVGPIGLASLVPSPGNGATQAETRAAIREAFGIAPEAPLAVTVARLTEQKGYRTFMEAASAILAGAPDLVLLWIGEGELQPEIERWLAAEGLGERVKLAGFRSNVREFLKAADLFVLPTLYEGGCSQALLEALDESLPVVVTDTSAVAEVVSHEDNGLLVPAGNAPALASAVGRLLADADLGDRLRTGARQMANYYSAERSFEETLARFRAVSARRGVLTGTATWTPPPRFRPISILSAVSIRSDETGFGTGWHDPERAPDGHGFRWMGHTGTVTTDVALDHPALVEVTGYSSLSRDALTSLSLHCDDVELARVKERDVVSDHEWSLTWRLESTAVSDRRAVLRFSSRGAQRPKDISATNQDDRWLSVAIRKIQMQVAD